MQKPLWKLPSERHVRERANSTKTDSEILLPNVTEPYRIVLRDSASVCVLN